MSSLLSAAARALLDDDDALPRATWPRAVAFVARQALESAVGGYLDRLAGSGVSGCSATTQLLCLPWYLGDQRAARLAHETWAALSNACHHHAYDLSPTASELEGWLADVEAVLTALEPTPA